MALPGRVRLSAFSDSCLLYTSDPTSLEATLESKVVRGLYGAGQFNGCLLYTSIQFAYQRAFCRAADAGIAGHIADGIQTHGCLLYTSPRPSPPFPFAIFLVVPPVF